MSEGLIAGNVAAEAAGTGETQTSETTTPQGTESDSSGTPQSTSASGDGQGSSINPAWKPLLDSLPTSLHHLVTPHLSQWDKGVQDRFQQINQKYQPYEAFVEQQIDPEILSQAMGLYQILDENPQQLFEAFLAQGFTVPEAQQATKEVVEQGQGQESVGNVGEFEDPSYDIEADPRFQRLQQMVEAMASSQISTFEAQQTAEVEAEIDAELASVKQVADQHNIPWNERAIVRIMSTDGVSAEQAFRTYVEEIRTLSQAAQQQPTPVVVGGGGGVPSRQIDRSQITGQDRRKLVQQILEQSAANG